MKKIDSNAIIQAIRRSRKQIKSYGVRRIGLFGSYASGRPRPGSDIDIIVDFIQGGKTFDNYMGLKFFLEDRLGRKVDLVIAEAVKPRLRPYIISQVKYVQGL